MAHPMARKKVPHAFQAFVMQILSPPRVTTNSLAPLTKHPPSHQFFFFFFFWVNENRGSLGYASPQAEH